MSPAVGVTAFTEQHRPFATHQTLPCQGCRRGLVLAAHPLSRSQQAADTAAPFARFELSPAPGPDDRIHSPDRETRGYSFGDVAIAPVPRSATIAFDWKQSRRRNGRHGRFARNRIVPHLPPRRSLLVARRSGPGDRVGDESARPGWGRCAPQRTIAFALIAVNAGTCLWRGARRIPWRQRLPLFAADSPIRQVPPDGPHVPARPATRRGAPRTHARLRICPGGVRCAVA